MKFQFSFRGKRFSVRVVDAGFIRKGFGLMFRSSNTENLLFRFTRRGNRSLTALFVFFPFLVLWIYKKKVVDWKIVKPFTLSINTKKKFDFIVELPINQKNHKILRFFDGKRGNI